MIITVCPTCTRTAAFDEMFTGRNMEGETVFSCEMHSPAVGQIIQCACGKYLTRENVLDNTVQVC